MTSPPTPPALPDAARGPGWFAWRQAAAGLGWGVLVGAATGVLVGLGLSVVWALDAAGAGDQEGIGPASRLGLVVGLPLLGLVYGGALGAVAGVPGGLLNAVVQPRVRGERRAWWSSWLIATGCAAGTVLLVASWQAGRHLADPPGLTDRLLEGGRPAVLALPSAVVGGWLTARTTRALRRGPGNGPAEEGRAPEGWGGRGSPAAGPGTGTLF